LVAGFVLSLHATANNNAAAISNNAFPVPHEEDKIFITVGLVVRRYKIAWGKRGWQYHFQGVYCRVMVFAADKS
jgi:hypothetical protein